MTSCIPWLILASFVVLGTAGGFATFWAYFNFPDGQHWPQNVPEVKNVTKQDQWNSRRYSSEITDEYRDYKEATRRNSNYYNDSRLYVVIPCGVSALVSIVLVLAGLCSRKIFSTTVVLYSSLSLWIVNLAVLVWFQYAAYSIIQIVDSFAQTFFLINGIFVGQLLVLTLQVILAAWELRKQNVTWPSFQILNLFTINMVILAVRMTLCVFCIISFDDSSMRYGMINTTDGFELWQSPREKFPDYLVMPTVVIMAFGVVVTLEGLLSLIVGNVHNKIMGLTGLLSAAGFLFISGISSPSAMLIITGLRTFYGEYVMCFSLPLGLVSLLHGILSLTIPTTMSRSPVILKDLAQIVSSSFKGLFSNRDLDFSQLSRSPMLNNVRNFLKDKYNGRSGLYTNMGLLVLAGISVILASIAATEWPTTWSAVVIIAGDVAIISRVLTSIVTEMYTHYVEEMPQFKIVFRLFLEGTFVFVGAIGSFFDYSGSIKGAGVLNLIIVLAMIMLVVSQAKRSVPAASNDEMLINEDQPLEDDGSQITAEPTNDYTSVPVV